MLEDAEQAAADEPNPETPLDGFAPIVDGDSEAKREARRQRRKSRPHGRAR
jgi:hypothetical protein